MFGLVIFARDPEASCYELDISPRSCNPVRRLLLESVQHIDSFREADRIYRAKSISTMVLHDLQDSRSLASPRFRAGVFPAELRDAERRTDGVSHSSWKREQVLL